MKAYQLALIALTLPIGLLAQTETTLPALSRTHQASYINPAILPAYSTSFGTPVISGLGVNLQFQGLTARNVLQSMDTGYISIPKLYNKINQDRLDIDLSANYEIFHYRFRSKNWYYGINLNTRTLSNIALAKEWVGLVANGNDYYAGKTIDFSSTAFSIMSFNELGFSMARNLNRFNIGFRAKIYQGLAMAQTNNIKLNIQQPESPAGEVRATLGGEFRTSGIPVLLTDSIDGHKKTGDEDEFSTDALTSLKNFGSGIDLGVTYDVNNRLTVGASLIDFGFINWTNQTFTYEIKDANVSFDGMNDDQIRNDSTLNDEFDSIGRLLTPRSSSDGFTTFLPWRYFLSANYKLNQRNTIGAVIQGRYVLGKIRQAYTLSYSRKFGDNFDLTANYSIIGKNYTNLGLGWAVKWGVVQWYMVHDNILAYIQPSTASVVSVRMGINFVWGEIRRPLKVY